MVVRLVLLYTLITLQSLVAQLNVYVATNGSGSNDGLSLATPFANVFQARDFLRTQTLPQGAIVNIRGGEYFFTARLDLFSQDAGAAGAPIIYRAYNGEEVRFSGASTLQASDFVPVPATPAGDAIRNRVIDTTARAALLQVDLSGIDLGTLVRRGWGRIFQGVFPNDDPEFELIIGGERMTLARWPNPEALPARDGDPLGTVDMSAVVDAGPRGGDADLGTAGGTFRYSTTGGNPSFPENRPALWSNATDIWLSGTLDRAWEWDYIPVASVDSVNQEITLAEGTDSGINAFSESFFHFENLLEEIDRRGEYYIDRKTETLYIYPPANLATADIRYTVNQNFHFIRLLNADYVHIEDIIFENSRRGAIDSRADGVRIRRCEFRNLRTNAMLISGEDSGVQDCVFHDIGERGIIVGEFGASSNVGDVETLTPGNIFVENCEFYDISYHTKNYRPAVQLLSGVSPRISHCYFHDNPHFSIGGSENNGIIEYNRFENTPSLLADIGAVYYNTGFNPTRQGTLIRRNYFHNIGFDVERGKMSAVYLDNASRGFTIEENVFNRIGKRASDWTVFNHGAAPGAVKNNIFVDCVNPITHAYALVLNTYMRIDMFSGGWESLLGAPGQPNRKAGTKFLDQYPELTTLIPEDGDYELRKASPIARITRNLFYNPNSTRLNTGDGVDDGVEISTPPASLTGILEQADNFVATSDPGFTDATNDDFSFTSGASVFTSISGFNDPEFKRNGVEQMGLSGPVGPRSIAAVPADPALSFDRGEIFTANAGTGVAYSATVQPELGTVPVGDSVTFEKVSGPDWLSVASDGSLSGMPSADDLGLNHFAVRAIGSSGVEDESILRLSVVNSALQFAGSIVENRDAVVDRSFFGSLGFEVENSDWNNLVTFSNLSGPSWLSLSSEGKLTGTPASVDLGDNQWTVRVTDEAGNIDTAFVSIRVVAAPASVLYVDGANGNNANDGSSWIQAKATIQGALSMATAGTEVYVAQGTYGGTLSPPSGVSLFGGFATGDTFAQRDPETKVTISSPGHFRAVAKNDILVDGFTFTNAPDGFSNPIFIDTTEGQPDTDNIVVSNCKMVGNGSRGVVLVRGVSLTANVHNVSFIDCEMSGNSSAGDFAGHMFGSGVYGELSFDRCQIHSNSVGATSAGPGSGGFDFIGPNALKMQNCLFYNNTTANGSRATHVSISGGRKSEILHCTFDGDGSASGTGEALLRVTSGSGVNISNSLLFGGSRVALRNLVTGQTSMENTLFFGNGSNVSGSTPAETETQINALGWATNCLVTDPAVMDSVARDYRPKAGSPLIDAGAAATTLSVDLLGKTRAVADIGALEYDPDNQDSDGDLIVDVWEVLYGLSPSSPADAAADLDGDGNSNLYEYVTGSLPNSAADLWAASVTEENSLHQSTTRFDTFVGRTYRIQRSYTLSGPASWTTLQTYAGDGTEKSLTTTEVPGQLEAFYRVEVTLDEN